MPGRRLALCLVIPAVAVAAAALAMTSTGSSAVVSPVSAGRIAYYRELPPCRLESGSKECSHGIWTGNLDGSGERRLTPTLNLEVLHPEWSPDRAWIAYEAGTGRARVGELWVMKANGSAKRKLPIAAPFSYEYGNLISSWSPDGRTIIVAASRVEKRKTTLVTPIVLAVPVNGAKTRELFALPRGKYSAAVRSPQLSPSGKLIAFVYSRDCCSSGLFVSRPDGSKRKRLSSAYAGDPGRALDWSPDGRRIVFARQVNNDGSLVPELHVIKADGTGLRRLTNTEGNNGVMTPSWSPDGRQIVFSSGAAFDPAGLPVDPGEYGVNNNNRFAVINSDGSGLHLVGPGATNCLPKGAHPSEKWCYASDPSWWPR